jgi:predicted DNA-binding transcriptional regulator AlpA
MDNTTTRVPDDDTSWDPQQVADYLQVSVRHIRDVRQEDETFPPPRMVGTRPRWSPDVIRRWVADGGGPTRPPAGPTRPTGPKRRGPGRV